MRAGRVQQDVARLLHAPAPVLPLPLALALAFALAGCSPHSLSDGTASPTSAAPLLRDVRVVAERATVTGYDRSRFGGWSDTGGCSTRDAVLDAWFGGVGCGGDAGQGASASDPYTGEPLLVDDADIDHVYPLAAAWDFGAHAWGASDRRAFANDMEANLVPTASDVNRRKSDLTPAEWLPEPRELRCPYSVRYLTAAVRWDLPVSAADWAAMAEACGLD